MVSDEPKRGNSLNLRNIPTRIWCKWCVVGTLAAYAFLTYMKLAGLELSPYPWSWVVVFPAMLFSFVAVMWTASDQTRFGRWYIPLLLAIPACYAGLYSLLAMLLTW
jgi:hypothetical protein